MNIIALQVCGLVFAGTLVAAAVRDLRDRTIPNLLPAILIAAFVPAAWFGELGSGQTALHVGAAAAALVVAAVLFALRAWGGGDAKLVAAVALWIGFVSMPRFLLVMSLAGGLLALALLLARGRNAKVPYGVAIALAGLDWWYGALASQVLS